MKKVSRNKVSGFSVGRLYAIAQNNAKEYNETWYVLGDSGIATNNRRGYEQYDALTYYPNGQIEIIKSQV